MILSVNNGALVGVIHLPSTFPSPPSVWHSVAAISQGDKPFQLSSPIHHTAFPLPMHILQLKPPFTSRTVNITLPTSLFSFSSSLCMLVTVLQPTSTHAHSYLSGFLCIWADSQLITDRKRVELITQAPVMSVGTHIPHIQAREWVFTGLLVGNHLGRRLNGTKKQCYVPILLYYNVYPYNTNKRIGKFPCMF